jgi:hypothetical protein
MQLRGDPVVFHQRLEHLVPDGDVRVGRRGHGAPWEDVRRVAEMAGPPVDNFG